MRHPFTTEDILAEHDQLDSIAETFITVEAPRTQLERTVLSFFSHIDPITLDDDLEAIEELRDISARNRNEFEEPLDRVLEVLRNLQDIHESIYT